MDYGHQSPVSLGCGRIWDEGSHRDRHARFMAEPMTENRACNFRDHVCLRRLGGKYFSDRAQLAWRRAEGWKGDNFHVLRSCAGIITRARGEGRILEGCGRGVAIVLHPDCCKTGGENG